MYCNTDKQYKLYLLPVRIYNIFVHWFKLKALQSIVIQNYLTIFELFIIRFVPSGLVTPTYLLVYIVSLTIYALKVYGPQAKTEAIRLKKATACEPRYGWKGG
jgi:hypothetical protein